MLLKTSYLIFSEIMLKTRLYLLGYRSVYIHLINWILPEKKQDYDYIRRNDSCEQFYATQHLLQFPKPKRTSFGIQPWFTPRSSSVGISQIMCRSDVTGDCGRKVWNNVSLSAHLWLNMPASSVSEKLMKSISLYDPMKYILGS